jgi:hypothetical protein
MNGHLLTAAEASALERKQKTLGSDQRALEAKKVAHGSAGFNRYRRLRLESPADFVGMRSPSAAARCGEYGSGLATTHPVAGGAS